MGRHSAPDDDEDAGLEAGSSIGSPATSVATVPPGRHSREGGPRPRPARGRPDNELSTEIPLAELIHDDRPLPEEVIAQLAPVGVDEPSPIAAAPTGPARAARGAHATRHDLALVTSHGDVRARVLAAVLVPFVVFVAVLAIIGALRVHSLVWVWAPAIAAGVLVGLVLDAGHRRHPAPTDVSEPAPLA